MFKTETKTPQQVLATQADRQVATARFHPNGELLVTGGYDGSLRRWRIEKEALTETEPIAGHNGWIERIVFHPDSATDILVSSDSWGRLMVCHPSAENSESGQRLWKHDTAHDGRIHSLTLSADGEQIITAGQDRYVRVWETKTGKRIHDLNDHDSEVMAAAMHPHGKSVVAGDVLGVVKEWDLQSRKCVRDLDLSRMHFYDRDQDVAGLKHLRFLDDGATLVAAGMDPKRTGNVNGIPSLHFLDWKTGAIRESLVVGDNATGFVFDFERLDDGSFLIVTSGTPGNGRVLWRHPDEDEFRFEFKKLSNCHALAMHPDRHRFFVSATNRNSQGNGAVRDKETGAYLGNTSPLHLFELPEEQVQ
ncbi:WD40 repeat domain-containing protein [Thalassoroseus pseudoceratinae]|uniref:WD40 repeat domain-containing protein n=1 Tax=Thalassoroseus pseudoceratinae TaxID=2713176 RepID=UPI001422EB95|nr:hypothetical protein [Thalassoroseus pseudoceratinae]